MKQYCVLQIQLSDNKTQMRCLPIMPVTFLTDRWRCRFFPDLVHDLHHLGRWVVQGSVLHNGQSFWSLTLFPGKHPLVFLLNHDVWGVGRGKVHLARFAQTDSQHGRPWTSSGVHSTGRMTATMYQLQNTTQGSVE